MGETSVLSRGAGSQVNDIKAGEAARSKAPLRGDTGMRRLTDLLLAVPALILLSPALALIAILVKIDDPGPALYAQERVGKGGRPFKILKFRSMVADADSVGPQVAGKRDRRITRIGRFLRAAKLDELPQLFNIVRGEMTFFGPRPEVPRYVPYFTEEEKTTLSVRPGLTGAGQLFYTDAKAEELDRAQDPEAHYIEHQLHEKLACDLDYLRRRSAALDIAILGRTAAKLIGRRG